MKLSILVYAYGIIPVDETIKNFSKKLDSRNRALKRTNFKISRIKLEYLICNFVYKTREISSLMMTKCVKVPKCEAFFYVESIIQRDNGIKEDINYKTKALWMREKDDSLLCDKRAPTRLHKK